MLKKRTICSIVCLTGGADSVAGSYFDSSSYRFACTGIGVLTGVISTNSRVVLLWSQLIFLPSMLIGGLMIPHSVLPDTLAKITFLLPATHAMEAFKGLAFLLPYILGIISL